MNEAQVNETQTEDVQADETPDGEVTLVDGNGSVGLAKMRRIRLNGFLRELVRHEGRVEAAELLGVAYRTVVRAEESGEITGRMSDALERLLGTGDDPEVAKLRERVDALEKELRDGLDVNRAAASGQTVAEDIGGGQPQHGDGDGAARVSSDRPAPPVVGLRPKKPPSERQFDPEIVTVDPAEDDTDVYGAAWPLVEEWRRLRVEHPSRGKSLLWLTTEERLLVLELAMLEEHGLTLPPEKQPLRGFGRKGQTTHRWKALADTRRALRRRKLLRWVAPWLWREKALEPSPGPVSRDC